MYNHLILSTVISISNLPISKHAIKHNTAKAYKTSNSIKNTIDHYFNKSNTFLQYNVQEKSWRFAHSDYIYKKMMIMKNSQVTVLQFVYDFFLAMEVNDINLAYEGIMTPTITKAFTYLTESKLQDAHNKLAQKKVFLVMVECMQNMSRHACRNLDDKYGRGIFMVSRAENCYKIIAGNAIENSKLPEFLYYLDFLNNQSKEKLDDLYKLKLYNSTFSKDGNESMGLLDIARTIENKFIYKSMKLNDDYSFIAIIFIVNT